MSDWWENLSIPKTPMQKVLEDHRMTDKSVGGFLGLCSCGEAVDWDTEHWADMLEKEGFGDLKPARSLVEAWKTRSDEIRAKAIWHAESGSSEWSVRMKMLRAQSYNFLANQLNKVVNGE